MQEPDHKQPADRSKSFYQQALERERSECGLEEQPMSMLEAAAVVAADEDVDEIPASIPVPRSRMKSMGRRSSAHLLASPHRRKSSARTASISRKMSFTSSKDSIASRESIRRSWDMDQYPSDPTNSTATAAAAAAAATTAEPDHGFGDDEVLEQYRIMAHHEAHQRVLQQLGYDPSEQTPPKAASPEPELTVALPKMAEVSTTSASNTAVPGPCSVVPILEDATNVQRQDELQVGSLGSARQITAGLVAVRCLGCEKNLFVDSQVTLVKCPSCGTVSSATSTRR